ncbi:MAG: hypothetical protein JF612_14595 [Planctomycetia bacterium]|jgi:hypothetical protein|nr:hypothetical protein [Planctomycetia bacterium]
MATKHCPTDDVWSAPESGTVRDDTSGNQPAHPHERGAPADEKAAAKCGSTDKTNKDDPCFAGEER